MLELIDTPCKADFTRILRALDEETGRVAGQARPHPLAVLLRDDSGEVAGGLWGFTLYSWLSISMLFVPEPLRGRGAGIAMVSLAEEAARERGCIGVQVDAFDFQAAGFYEKLGYKIFGVQENNPPGHRRLYFTNSFHAKGPGGYDMAKSKAGP